MNIYFEPIMGFCEPLKNEGHTNMSTFQVSSFTVWGKSTQKSRNRRMNLMNELFNDNRAAPGKSSGSTKYSYLHVMKCAVISILAWPVSLQCDSVSVCQSDDVTV